MSAYGFPIRVPGELLEALGAHTGHFWSSLDLEPVICDMIREHAISPSCFANLHGSGNRNAWKSIWLRLPGSEAWLLADVCRSARKAAIARLLGGDVHEAS